MVYICKIETPEVVGTKPFIFEKTYRSPETAKSALRAMLGISSNEYTAWKRLPHRYRDDKFHEYLPDTQLWYIWHTVDCDYYVFEPTEKVPYDSYSAGLSR